MATRSICASSVGKGSGPRVPLDQGLQRMLVGDGNVEFLVHARRGADPLGANDWAAARDMAVADAEGAS